MELAKEKEVPESLLVAGIRPKESVEEKALKRASAISPKKWIKMSGGGWQCVTQDSHTIQISERMDTIMIAATFNNVTYLTRAYHRDDGTNAGRGFVELLKKLKS